MIIGRPPLETCQSVCKGMARGNVMGIAGVTSVELKLTNVTSTDSA